jgi:hypothetical protein
VARVQAAMVAAVMGQATAPAAAAAAATAAAGSPCYPDTEAMAQLDGYVRDELQPLLAPGEVRALGQTMHPDVAPAYEQVRQCAAHTSYTPRALTM